MNYAPKMNRRTFLELSDEGARVVRAPARRLGDAPHVVVARPLRFHPGLLEVGHHQHHLVDLAVEVGAPLIRGRKTTTLGLQHVIEMTGDRFHLAHVVLHPG